MMDTRLLSAGIGFLQPRRLSPRKVASFALYFCFFPLSHSGQWVLTSIHPDPTPSLGAPEAEFIALTALVTGDTCVTSDGWSLDWNDSPRPCAWGCWPMGTTLVAHRGSDSADFDFGSAVSMPMDSWPALVNGGGLVLLRNPDGVVVDAMSYSSESLGSGGRPLMRSDTQHCGAAANQHLWEPGMNPFFGPQPQALQSHQSLISAFEEAREPNRLVPRGSGTLDWFLGTGMNPTSMRAAEARVGGHPAVVEWLSDSVVRFLWDERPRAGGDIMEDGIPISIGPLSGCFHGEEAAMLTARYRPLRSSGDIAVVGALADPISTDPAMPWESIALLNRSEHTVGLGSWSFGGGDLRRQIMLPSDSVVWLNARDFEGWPGMTNAGGSMNISSPLGSVVAALSWSPCDHDVPALSGSGMPMVRSGSPGSAWHSAGFEVVAAPDPMAIKGYGCVMSEWTGLERIELYLNRYLDQLGTIEWSIEGNAVPPLVEPIPGRPDGVSLSWEGAENTLAIDGRVAVSLEHEGVEVSRIEVQCPDEPWFSNEAPCLRIVELLWNASDGGDEFAEVQNCGSVPVDLSGLQATTASVPLPSDWYTWVPEDVSLVLAPGEVAAFGRCPKWMGFELPQKGPSRWSAERWTPLNDAGGTLKIRLPRPASLVLDEVEWGPELKGPWWWTEDGWAWERSGVGREAWSPAPGRGSPGAPPDPKQPSGCGQLRVKPSILSGGLPAVEWALPMAGGTIVVNMVEWPSGELLGRAVLEDLLSEGRWSWVGRQENGRTPRPGVMLWDVRWWVGQCRGRKRIRVDIPGHG